MTDYKILVAPPARHRRWWIALVVTVVVALVAVGAVVVARRGHTAASGPDPKASGPAGTGSSSSVVPSSLRVVSTTPATGATNVPVDQTVSIHLSSPVTLGSRLPTWSPAVPGTWTMTGPKTLSFVATAPFVPTASETLTIPSGAGGLQSTSGARLTTATTVSFTVAQGTYERLQQILAQLGYLPLTFTPSGPLTSPAESFTPQPGTFAWRWPNTPSSLTALWSEGSENVITQGAVMNFQNQAGLTVDGIAGKSVWTAMLADLSANKLNANPYDYVFVSKQLPEALTLFSNGVADPQLTNIAVNTGVPGADTPDGTYPVFEHVVSSRMKGTNPNGTTYNDPAVPWASFFHGGDALHGFVRATYGSYQSNGCVEMPVATAAIVWPLTPIGTLVTVVGPVS
jgi:peptidoglycan hydrolase-like protein with peptidoglycan-binding domain